MAKYNLGKNITFELPNYKVKTIKKKYCSYDFEYICQKVSKYDYLHPEYQIQFKISKSQENDISITLQKLKLTQSDEKTILTILLGNIIRIDTLQNKDYQLLRISGLKQNPSIVYYSNKPYLIIEEEIIEFNLTEKITHNLLKEKLTRFFNILSSL